MYDVSLLRALVDLVFVETGFEPVFCCLRLGLVLSFQLAIHLPP